MKISLITDAWKPQVNGVVRTLTETVSRLRQRGHIVDIVSPDQFRSIACPGYTEIRLAVTRRSTIAKRIDAFEPDAIHIATEGPLGHAARHYCIRNDIPFSTAYHTQFPDYMANRTHLPSRFFWPYIRRFHRASHAVLVSTASTRQQLSIQGIGNLRHWGRGVDLKCFGPDQRRPAFFADLPRPIQLYVGRIAVEKNVADFLNNRHPGSKVVIGNGPMLGKMKAQYPSAHFLGRKTGRELSEYYAAADVFVFPSKTDTFGLVMLEALACGTPVAAYPVRGPIDILSPASGAMNDSLATAIAHALRLDPKDCICHARTYNWDSSTNHFLAALIPIQNRAEFPGLAA